MYDWNKPIRPLILMVQVIHFGQGHSLVFVIMKVAADCPLESASRPKPAITNFRVNAPQQWGKSKTEFSFHLRDGSSTYRRRKGGRRIHVVAPMRIGSPRRHKCKDRVFVHACLVKASER